MAIREKLKLILSVNEPPHRLSTAFAVGVFIGMSPLLGLHTVLGIVIAYLFRLNRFVTLVGVYITNPWTIIPIYTFSTWLGSKCLRIEHVCPDTDWKHMTLRKLTCELTPLVKPFIVGTIITGLAAAAIGYFMVYHMTKRKDG